MNFTTNRFNPTSNALRRLRTWGIKLICLVLIGVVQGFCYQWAVPKFYRPETKAGFWLGSIHGVLMPVALPNLLAGKDVPIFTANNTGRTYKLGYIAGIDLWGLAFFGLFFRFKKAKDSSKI